MRFEKLIFTTIVLLILSWTSKPEKFDIENDLLLVQYDCKTDVDDLHSIAAFATLISNARFSEINYHAVAGAYGTQGGLYVPPNELFELVFGNKWTDAHQNFHAAIKEVKQKAKATLDGQGDIWIAEAGQSDFSARLVKAIQADWPDINTTERIHIIQHSDWNEKATSPESLRFVKQNTSYEKIPDGNAAGNSTPGFRTSEEIDLTKFINKPRLHLIWQRAHKLANKYNGTEERYLNEAIQAGGLDFSDFSEVCWIFNLHEIKNSKDFFTFYGN